MNKNKKINFNNNPNARGKIFNDGYLQIPVGSNQYES